MNATTFTETKIAPTLPDLTLTTSAVKKKNKITHNHSNKSTIDIDDDVDVRKNSYVSSCSSEDGNDEDEVDESLTTHNSPSQTPIASSRGKHNTIFTSEKIEKKSCWIPVEEECSIILKDENNDNKYDDYVSSLETRVASLEQTIQTLISTIQQQQTQISCMDNNSHVSSLPIQNNECENDYDDRNEDNLEHLYPTTPNNNMSAKNTNMHIALVDSPSPGNHLLPGKAETNVQLEYRSFTPDYEEELRSLRHSNNDNLTIDDDEDLDDDTALSKLNPKHLENIDSRCQPQTIVIPNTNSINLKLRRRSLSFDFADTLKSNKSQNKNGLYTHSTNHISFLHARRLENISRPNSTEQKPHHVEETHVAASLGLPPLFPQGSSWNTKNNSNVKESNRKESIGAQSDLTSISVGTAKSSEDKKGYENIAYNDTLKVNNFSSVEKLALKSLFQTPISSFAESDPISSTSKFMDSSQKLQPQQQSSSSKSTSDTPNKKNNQLQSHSINPHPKDIIITSSTIKQTSKTATNVHPSQGLLSILKGMNLDSKQQDGSATEHVDENMEEFIKVPHKLEQLLFFGLAICVDAFLNIVTLFPIKLLWSTFCLIRTVVQPWNKSKFHRRHFYQLIRAFVIFAVCNYFLAPISIGKTYHWIRGQSMIKLYVVIAMVEVFDRLMCSLGQDAMDSLYWNTTRRPFHPRCLVSAIVVLVYAVLHSGILFIHIATLNVAMNSSDQALLSLLIGGNFAEIKSTVFKKYNKQNLFKITTSDICERFKLVLFLSLVLLLNCSQGGMDDNMINGYINMCIIILLSECLCDWIKHMFITKFNFIKSSVYPDYALILAGDITGHGFDGANIDHTHAAVKRLGFSQIPLVCVMIRYLREALRYANLPLLDDPPPDFDQSTLFNLNYYTGMTVGLWKRITVLFSLFLILLAFKILLSYAIQRISESMLYGPSQKEPQPISSGSVTTKVVPEGATKIVVSDSTLRNSLQKPEISQQRRQAV